MKTIKYLICLLALITVRANAQSTLEVWTEKSTEITADGTTVTYLTFYQKDPNINYIAFQAAITVPKGIKINQTKSGRLTVNDIKLCQDRVYDHTIACNLADENTIKISAMSSELQELYPDDENGNPVEELFTIGLVGDPSMYNGSYEIEIWDLLFGYRDKADNQLKHNDPEPIYMQMTVTGGQDFPGIDYVLSSHQWGTLILPFSCEIPNGMSAYTCEGISDDNKLILSKHNSFQANVPYIVGGTPGNYHLNGTYCAFKDVYSTDYMTGVYVEKEVPQGAYVLQNHEATSGFGFYRVGSTAVNCPAYRCYLTPMGTSVMMFSLGRDNISTQINATETDDESSPVYTIDGKYVGKGGDNSSRIHRLPKGVYIKNQKKILNK
ncbi:MAG: hypothetical protein MR421_09815 [Prevotella sp.]|nr:hypothetical protein [Prevotella sp.]